MKKDLKYIFISLFLLILGSAIYVFFREPVIFTSPLQNLGIKVPLFTLSSGFWGDFVKFTIPDVLWDTALLFYASGCSLWILKVMALLIAPLYEIGQLLRFLPGTFDSYELIVYLIINIIFLAKWIKKEKDSSRLPNV